MGETDEQFIERVGRFFEAEGAPRTLGRILGLMLLTPGELTLDEIAERLRVSKASISTNARRMEAAGVLERRSRPGDRRDFYRVAEDLPARLLERQVDRVRGLAALVEHGATTPSAAADAGIRARFRRLREYHACAAGSLEGALRRFRTLAPAAGGQRAS